MQVVHYRVKTVVAAARLVHVGVGRQAGAGRGAVTGDDVQHARGEAGLQRQLTGAERRQGRLLRRLHGSGAGRIAAAAGVLLS